VRSCRSAGWPGMYYRVIDIPRSPRRVHNRAATVRESGTLLAVKPFCTIVSVSTRMSGCHAPRRLCGLQLELRPLSVTSPRQVEPRP
jgi:hypothetical protein